MITECNKPYDLTIILQSLNHYHKSNPSLSIEDNAAEG